ncbi:hypothetical protein Scep_030668 [Stephania cephalantha]|uniref:C2 domain-containing protein n=1 Tax=Stephania cephalantha TaxID=152367 RepID=A0AAP0E4J4_9MAGN
MERTKKLEIILESATGLKDVRTTGRMRVYATGAISEGAFSAASLTSMQATEADTTGETNPVWNTKMSFTVPETDPLHRELVFGLFCQRSLLEDKCLDVVRVPLSTLIAGRPSVAFTEVSYPISNGRGGKLNFYYRFQDLSADHHSAIHSSSTVTRGVAGPSYSSGAGTGREVAPVKKLGLDAREVVSRLSDVVEKAVDGAFDSMSISDVPDLISDIDFPAIGEFIVGVLGSI